MDINADFDQAAFAHTDTIEWLASPMAGVDRRMLDRIGDEVARATSIVRYAEGSAFSEHTHSGGEEFIVLEGVFQDEHGDYPAGTYVRNPVGTHHIPRSDPGCTIFVKLWQFDPDDQEQFAVDLSSVELIPDSEREGVSRAVLAARDYEHVSLESWDSGVTNEVAADGGLEILLLGGEISFDGESYAKHDWLRLPSDHSATLAAGPDGARLWIKRGHLKNITIPG
ncbi:MAG: cupin domain-containing protein [Pseudomonadota bacterium]